MAVGPVMNHPALQEAADLIEGVLETWPHPVVPEAYYRLAMAHDAITQADALLGPHGPEPTPPRWPPYPPH